MHKYRGIHAQSRFHVSVSAEALHFPCTGLALVTSKRGNYERYLMIVRSAGIVRKSLIRSQNILNFGYALYLALRERKIDSV